MKKRLRKKLQRGEFSILAFRVNGDNLPDWNDDIWDELITLGYVSCYSYRSPVVWVCDGCNDHKFRQTNTADQECIKLFLEARGAVNIKIGPLFDICDSRLYK